VGVTTTKFNVKFSAGTYHVMGTLADQLEVPMAEIIREALSLFWWITKEVRQGNKLLVQRGNEVSEMVIPSLERLKPEPTERPRELVPSDIGGRPRKASQRPAASADAR
jgi:hypothetical protein